MDRTAELAARAAARAPPASLDELLAEILAGNDLNTLLLHAFRARARRRGLPGVLQADRVDAAGHLAALDARAMTRLDERLWAAAGAFEAVEPSPVLPLGTSAAVGVEPNHVVCAPRGLEVASDPSLALFLEIHRRRVAGAAGRVNLAASQRVVRMNPLADPRHSRHFRLAALASAERNGDPLALLALHAATWLALFSTLQAEGHPIAAIAVQASDTRVVAAALRIRGEDPVEWARRARAHDAGATAAATAAAGLRDPDAVRRTLPDDARRRCERLEEALLAPLRARWPALATGVDPCRLHGLGYYAGPTIKITIRHRDGAEIAIGDGGQVDWLARSRSDARERLVTSGIGIELIARLFARPTEQIAPGADGPEHSTPPTVTRAREQ